MNPHLTTQLKIATKAGFYVFSKVGIYLFFGLIINTIAFWSLWYPLIMDVGVGARTGAGAAMAVLWPLLSWQGIVVFALFFVIFPVAYLLMGKKQGINKALNYVINEDKVFIGKYLLYKFIEKYDVKENVSNQKELLTLVENSYEEYLQKLNNVPLVMRWMLKPIIKKLSVATFVDAIKSVNTPENNIDDVIDKACHQLNNKLTLELFDVSFKVPLVLFGSNLFAILLTVLFVV